MSRKADRSIRLTAARKTASAGASVVRALSKMGYCSRSQAQSLVEEGRVRVDGRVVQDPSVRVDLHRDKITVDGQQVSCAEKVYLMLNKPRGLVTTASDERGRETVYSCLKDPSLPCVSPVGRLDKASEGLLLFTNDGRWASIVLDPGTHLDKTYHVQVDCTADDLLLERTRRGVRHEGVLLKVKKIRVLRHGERNTWLEIILDEGKNRHIRKMMQALGVNVLRLVRVAIGPLLLGELRKGSYRHLTAQERDELAEPTSTK